MKRYLIRENGSNWFLPQMSQNDAMLDFERKVNEYSCIELYRYLMNEILSQYIRRNIDNDNDR